MMEELTQSKKASSRFLIDLCSSIECFRKGEDSYGLACFLKSMDELEALLKHFKFLGKKNESFEKIILAVQALHVHMKNQDIVGMTDLLEFTLYPLAKKWIEGCDEE